MSTGLGYCLVQLLVLDPLVLWILISCDAGRSIYKPELWSCYREALHRKLYGGIGVVRCNSD